MPQKQKVIDKHSYKGWLNSDSFLKRVFAIMGYSIVGTLIIYGIILGIILLIVVLIGIFELII